MVTLIVVEDGTSNHTGSTVVGPVAGTVSVGSNSFVKIEGKLVMVENGTMNIPSHKYEEPDKFHSHDYSPNTLQNSFVKIEGKLVVLAGDSYSNDTTNINSAGSNTFVKIL